MYGALRVRPMKARWAPAKAQSRSIVDYLHPIVGELVDRLGHRQWAMHERAFVGRDAQLQTIADAAAAARDGRAAVVWVEGDAGTGKSALVRHSLERVGDDFVMLRAEADEAAADLSFALVEQLGATPSAQPFAAGVALLERLGSAHGDRPVALVAEDLHWADAASRATLLTLARRMHHDRVLLLVTSRPAPGEDGWARFVEDPDRCARITLGGLDDAEVADLAVNFGVTLTSSQAARLRRHTEGHPLYVRTLLTELTPEQLTAASNDLPAPRSLASTTIAALTALPPESQAFATALAVLATRSPLGTVAEVGSVERPTEALEPLLHSGLVRWWPAEDQTPVQFGHPLYRAAVYDDIGPVRRRLLHLAASRVTRWGPSWSHRIAAADSPDDALADELDAGAQYEVGRGALSLAATYLAWSASVTTAFDLAEERLLRGARLLLLDGQTTRAVALYPRIANCAQTAQRDLVIGMLALGQADAHGAERWLTSVSNLGGPRSILADALGNLARLYALQGRGEDLRALRRELESLAPTGDGLIDRRIAYAVSMGAAMTAGPVAGLAELSKSLPRAPGDVDTDNAELLFTRGLFHQLAGRPHAAIADLRAAVDLSRRGSPFSDLPRAHLTLARALFEAGEWDEATAQARTARSLMDEHRVWMVKQAEATLALILAARGDHDQAKEFADAAAKAALAIASIEADTIARLAVAAVAAARADARGVVDVLGPLAANESTRMATPLTMLAWWPNLVRALIDTGELARATALLDELESTALRATLDVRVHVADLRARLAVAHGDPAAASALFEAAVGALSADHPYLDRALLHHAFGRLLRARGDRRRAREQLGLAHELLDRVAAEPYRRRVAADLGELGMRADPTTRRSPLALTGREFDVVALVRKGLTNREVGAQLYVSAKAVEYHLGNIYGKLGIRSRRELRDLPLSADRASSTEAGGESV
jgi:DNA-binding CsgD family transcriptional regulator